MVLSIRLSSELVNHRKRCSQLLLYSQIHFVLPYQQCLILAIHKSEEVRTSKILSTAQHYYYWSL